MYISLQNTKDSTEAAGMTHFSNKGEIYRYLSGFAVTVLLTVLPLIFVKCFCGVRPAYVGCLQLLIISWNLKLLLEILEISWNLVDSPGKFCN